jgi:hypothetical protein
VAAFRTKFVFVAEMQWHQPAKVAAMMAQVAMTLAALAIAP